MDLNPTLPKLNTIFKDHHTHTTGEIDAMVHASASAILVVDESYKDVYTGVLDLGNKTVLCIARAHPLGDKIQMPFRKFAVLVKLGIIRRDTASVIIFRLERCNSEFVRVFKIFYLRNLRVGDKRPLVLTYLKSVAAEDHIYLHSYLCPDLKSEMDVDLTRVIPKRRQVGRLEVPGRDVHGENKSIVNIFVTPQEDGTINEYMFYKGHLLNEIERSKGDDWYKLQQVHDKITELENITFKYGLYCLRELFKLGFTSNSQKYEYDPQLLIDDLKYRRLLQILKNHADFRFYIKTQNVYLINYLVAQINREGYIFPYTKDIVLKNDGNNIFIVYDGDMSDDTLRFYQVFIFHAYLNKEMIDQNIIINQIENYSIKDTEIDTCHFLRYMSEEIRGLAIQDSDAFIDFESGYVMLQNIFALINAFFKENYLALPNNDIKSSYRERNFEFSCTILLPQFHNEVIPIEGALGLTKKDAQKDAALKAIEFLYRNSFIDKNFLPVKERLIYRNRSFYYRICRYFKLEPVKRTGTSKDSPIYDFVEYTDENSIVSNEFLSYIERKGMKNDELNLKIVKIRDKYYKANTIPDLLAFKKKRTPVPLAKKVNAPNFDGVSSFIDFKQAECLKTYESTFFLYSFKEKDHDAADITINGYELGICTGSSFKEKLVYNDTEIEFIETVAFTEEQMKSIVFFQILIFVLYFRKLREHHEDAKEYCYFVVPMKNKGIDFSLLQTLNTSGFLLGDVYQNINSDVLHENFLYNPFTNKFYLYGEETDRSIHEREIFGNAKKSFLEYFEEKYKTKLLRTEDGNLLFVGYIFDKRRSTIPCILSSEIMQITSIKKNIGHDFEKLKKRLFAFEKAALAYEFKQLHSLNLDTQIVIQCLSAKNNNYPNYECLEFLGDCILKYLTVKLLFLTMVGDIVSYTRTKDHFISNESLFHVAKRLEITQYFSFILYCDALFQPPSLFKLMKGHEGDFKTICNDLIQYFNGQKIFASSNATIHEKKFVYDGDKVKGFKTYADIVEALIGAFFVTNGLTLCEEFIYKMRILYVDLNHDSFLRKNKKHEILIPYLKDIRNDFPETHEDLCSMKKYKGILTPTDISNIEEILNYTFKSPGLLEKAMIHPSTHDNVNGSVYFNKLELLGDSSIDLVVTIKIYEENKYNDPESLHTRRKSLVNNFTLARAIFKMGLIRYFHICFGQDYIDEVNRKLARDGESVNKAFGDVFESVCGAIIVDMDLEFGCFQEYFLANLYDVLNACADETR